MSKGEFDNLPLAGKPLPVKVDYNPYSDFTTHKMNEILVEGGFAPEWVTLQKEIRDRIEEIKKKLTKERRRLGAGPLNEKNKVSWDMFCEDFEEKWVKQLNNDIKRFNLLVPPAMFNKQMFLFDLKKEAAKVLENGCEIIIPEDKRELRSNEICDSKINKNENGSKLLDILKQLFIRVK